MVVRNLRPVLAGIARTLFTVGHSTRSPEELLALLRAAGVGAVADVRAFPSSRRFPHFRAGELGVWLPAGGVQYVGFPSLGGRRRPVPGSVNGGWREPAFQGYADYMSTSEFLSALAALEELAVSVPCAVMCAEAVWWRCHRRLIADALTVRGWRVLHLGVGGRSDAGGARAGAGTDPAASGPGAAAGTGAAASGPGVEHELTPFAVVVDGELRYPPAQAALFPSA